jgi:hypothetical protein
MSMIHFKINGIEFNVPKHKLLKYSGLFRNLLAQTQNQTHDQNEDYVFNIQLSVAQVSIMLFTMIKQVCPNNYCEIMTNEHCSDASASASASASVCQKTVMNEQCDNDKNDNNEFMGFRLKMSVQEWESMYTLCKYFMIDEVIIYLLKQNTDRCVDDLWDLHKSPLAINDYHDTVHNMIPCITSDPFYNVTIMNTYTDINEYPSILFKNIRFVNKKDCVIIGPKNRYVFEYDKSENMLSHSYLKFLCNSFEEKIGKKNPGGLLRHRHSDPFDGIKFFRDNDGQCSIDHENPLMVTIGSIDTPESLAQKFIQNNRYNVYLTVHAFVNSFEYGIQMNVIQVDDLMTRYFNNQSLVPSI